MFGEDYAYAVARIRVLETGLLNQAAIEQLLACQDERQCLQILTEKGWGNGHRLKQLRNTSCLLQVFPSYMYLQLDAGIL